MHFLRLLPAAAVLLVPTVFAQGDTTVSSASTTAATASSTGTATSTSATASPSSPSIPDPDDDPATRCRQADIVAFPFCTPAAHDIWRTDGNYYVTWDNDVWDMNSTVYLTLNYKTAGGAGPVAGEWKLANALGFYSIAGSPLPLPM